MIVTDLRHSGIGISAPQRDEIVLKKFGMLDHDFELKPFLLALLKEQIEIVRQGGEPMGVVRDPEKNRMIDLDVINERIGLYRATARSDELRAEAS